MAKVIPYEKLKRIIEGVREPWVKAFIALQYAGGSRIGELMQYNKTSGEQSPGLQKSRFDTREDAIDWVQPNFKTKQKTKQQKRPFVVKEERWLYDIIRGWIALSANQIFTRKLRQCHYKVAEALKPHGYTSHDLRHSRATHLVQQFDYNVWEIKEALGHAHIETSAIYVHPTKMKTKIREKITGGIKNDARHGQETNQENKQDPGRTGRRNPRGRNTTPESLKARRHTW